MDFLNEVNGLPTHPLVVHFALGLVVLGAIGGVLTALWPSRRYFLLPATTLVAVLGAVFLVVSTQSGGQLEERVGEGALVQQHAELGEQSRTIGIVLAVLLLVWWAVDRAGRRRTVRQQADRQPEPVLAGSGERSRAGVLAADARGRGAATQATGQARVPAVTGAPRAVAMVLAALTLVVSLASGVWIYRTGEAGAKAVWGNTPAAPAEGGQGGDGDR